MNRESERIATAGGVRGHARSYAARQTASGARPCPAESHLSHLIPPNPASRLSSALGGRRNRTATVARKPGYWTPRDMLSPTTPMMMRAMEPILSGPIGSLNQM